MTLYPMLTRAKLDPDLAAALADLLHTIEDEDTRPAQEINPEDYVEWRAHDPGIRETIPEAREVPPEPKQYNPWRF